MYRRALTPPVAAAQNPQPLADSDSLPARSTGYGWSRWWRRGQSAVPSSQPPPAPPQPATPPVAVTVSPSLSPAVSPTSTAVAAPESTVSLESTKTFAKTLRLSSDQLVCSPANVADTVETTETASRPKYCPVLGDFVLLWRGDVFIQNLPLGEYGPDCHFGHRWDHHQVRDSGCQADCLSHPLGPTL
jgi:hypothetical protein